MENIRLRDGLKQLMTISKLGNKYIQDTEPWVKFKQDNHLCGNIMHVCIHFINHLSSLLRPFLPNYSDYICKILNTNNNHISEKLLLETIDSKITNPTILFKRISQEDINKLKSTYG